MIMELLIKRFQMYMAGKDSSNNSIAAYVFDLKKFEQWYRDTTGEPSKPGSTGTLDVAEFKRYLLNRNQKPATINRAISSLSIFFSWCMDQGLAQHNPAAGVKPVKQIQPAPKSLSRTEQSALMRSVQASGKARDLAIITMLLHTGLRVSELCTLTVDDVTIKERTGSLVVRFGKGNKRREVPLNVTARNALQGWMQIRGDKPGAFFLSQKTGKGMTSRAVQLLLEKYSYQAKLENITPHVLRHTFCKSLVDAGESLDRVAVLAGHESLNTTSRYTRATGKDLERAVDKLAWE